MQARWLRITRQASPWRARNDDQRGARDDHYRLHHFVYALVRNGVPRRRSLPIALCGTSLQGRGRPWSAPLTFAVRGTGAANLEYSLDMRPLRLRMTIRRVR